MGSGERKCLFMKLKESADKSLCVMNKSYSLFNISLTLGVDWRKCMVGEVYNVKIQVFQVHLTFCRCF